jgi:hypothetical protein
LWADVLTYHTAVALVKVTLRQENNGQPPVLLELLLFFPSSLSISHAPPGLAAFSNFEPGKVVLPIYFANSGLFPRSGRRARKYTTTAGVNVAIEPQIRRG